MNPPRQPHEIAADLRDLGPTDQIGRLNLLVAEGMAALLDPPPKPTTLLGHTLAQWEAWPLTGEERDLIRAVFVDAEISGAAALDSRSEAVYRAYTNARLRGSDLRG